MKQSELVFVGILVAVALLAAVLIDVLIPNPQVSSNVANAGAYISSGWYCPAPSTAEDVQATMVTANPGPRPLGLRRLAVGGSGESAVVQGNLAAGHSGTMSLGEFKIPDAIGLVDSFGGVSSTDLLVQAKGKGAAVSRCSDQPGNRWLFASASTARGEGHVLLVANPFKEEAVIRVRFLAPDKDVVPARLKDVVVPTESQLAISLADYFLETPSFGLEVTATRGRVVVARYSAIASKSGASGISLDVGQPAPSTEWTFAEGKSPTTGDESIVIINPGSKEALVSVIFMTEGERTAPPGLAEIAVPAGRQISVSVADNLPKGTFHATALRSTNSEPVVAELRSAGSVSGDGFESTFGVPALARRWAVAVGTPGGAATTLSMVNPTNGGTSARITLLTAQGAQRPGDLDSLQVDAGRKRAVDLGPYLQGGPAVAVVESNLRPIAVEATTNLAAPYTDFSQTSGHPLP
jgi:hypothetical protein